MSVLEYFALAIDAIAIIYIILIVIKFGGK